MKKPIGLRACWEKPVRRSLDQSLLTGVLPNAALRLKGRARSPSAPSTGGQTSTFWVPLAGRGALGERALPTRRLGQHACKEALINRRSARSRRNLSLLASAATISKL